MTSKSSKALPFLVLVIVGGFMAVDMFTPYHITEPMINLATIVLTPIGLGGVIKKGWETYNTAKASGAFSDKDFEKLGQLFKHLKD